MSYPAHEQTLDAASERLIEHIRHLTRTALAGRDSVAYASKLSVLATQAALSDPDFWEALTVVHCDNLSLRGVTPCENPGDFAVWARQVAHERSIAPFPGEAA